MAVVPQKSGRVLAQQAKDSVILLSLDDGAYFTLNEVGGRVWELCDGERTTAEVVDVICTEFDAPADVVAADVLALLDDLSSEGLVAEAG
jgi:pyrroloquinoline quinone biosynthesis protein D